MTAARGSAGPARRRVFPAACLAAVGLTVVSYANSFGNAFHFDDAHVVEENLYIRGLRNVPRFFTDAGTFSSLPQNATYRPLVTTTLAFDYWMAGGLDVRQFHRTQFALHLALAAMLFVLYRAVLRASGERPWHRWAALGGAAWFAVHTGNTQTVNYISSRSELLSAMGVAGAFLVYLFARRARPWRLYLLPMAVGALAKVPAVVFGPLLAVYVLLFEERQSFGETLATHRGAAALGRTLRRTLPALAAGAALFLWIESMNAPDATYGGGGRLAYFRTQLFMWLHYARLFVVPAGLTADTDWGLIPSWTDGRVLAGVAFTVVLAAAAAAASRYDGLRPVAFGLAWFVVALLPASSVFPLAEVTNDHRMFLPYVGLTLAVVTAIAAGLERLALARPARRRAVTAAAAAGAFFLLGAHAVATHERNKAWRTAETLWRDTAEKSPRNGRALMNYGLTHMRAGRLVEARALFERARVFTPHYVFLEINLGIVNGALGDAAAAERHFERALALQPGHAGSHYFYGRWLVDEGRVPEAVPRLREAIRLAPGRPDARWLLMSLLYALDARAPHQALVGETLAVAPGDPVAAAYAGDSIPVFGANKGGSAVTRARELAAARRHLDAAVAARFAARLAPEDPRAWHELGRALGRLGAWREAVSALEDALRLAPQDAAVADDLAGARRRAGG